MQTNSLATILALFQLLCGQMQEAEKRAWPGQPFCFSS
jgi:hypothetical protein